jgi:hypothetical protein
MGDSKFSKNFFSPKCVGLPVGNPDENIEITRIQTEL